MANRFLNNIRINDAYTFPASDGNDGQVITTDGAGNLAFENVSPDAASVIYRDNFTGDGSTVTFDLQNSITDEDQTQIYIDGVYQEKSTYSISGTTITFTTAPILGHSVEVISISSINTGPTVLYQDNFTGNGNDTAFTLGQIIDNEIKTFIFLNGVYQFKNTYTLDGTTLTFDTAPANGVSIEVISIASAVQSDSLEAGSVIIPVKNTHTASISKGTPVYITGNVGASERLQIAPADASNSAKMPAAGLLLTTLAVNAEGYVITGGYLRNLTTDTIDGTSTSSNDTVYVKAGGGLTMTKPTGSNLIQNIAKIARSASGNSGSLIVSSILRTNDIPNLTTGKIWVGSANNTIESGTLHLDESNNRLGINNNNPSYSLDVTGDANISSNVIVGGNLTVQGTETILNTQTVEVEDNILQLNTTQGSPDTATATTSGISVYRGNGVTQASFIFDDADDTWDLTNNLVVAGTIDAGGRVKVSGGNTDQYYFEGLRNGVGVTYRLYDNANNIYHDSYTSQVFRLNQNGGSGGNLIITGGDVGIGTSSPSYKLHVEEATTWLGRFAYNANNYVDIRYDGFNVAGGDMVFQNAGSEKMRIGSGGYVGIGNTNPQTNLQVTGTATTKLRVNTTGIADSYVEIWGYDAGLHLGDNTNGNRWAIWNDGPSTSSSLKFGSYALGTWHHDSSQVVTMTSGGDVGVGTTSPGSKLDVNGDGKFVSNSSSRVLYLKQDAVNSGNIVQFLDQNGSNIWELVGRNNQFYIYNNALSNFSLYVNPSNNDIGIGNSSPGHKLDVSGKIRSTGGMETTYMDFTGPSSQIGTDTYTNGFYVYDNSAYRMVIKTGTGYVGIGYVNPNQKLDVNGNIGIPGAGKIVINNEPTAWFFQGRTTDSTSFLGTNLKNLLYCGGGASEGFAIAGTGTGDASFEIKNNGDAKIKTRLGIGTTDYQNSVLHAAGTISLESLGYNTFDALNTGSGGIWSKIGTWYTAQGGRNLSIKLSAGSGYNASLSQNGEVYIELRTSNGSAAAPNISGRYWTLGINEYISNVRVKEINQGEYEIYIQAGAYIGQGQIQAVHSLTDKFDRSISYNTGTPGGTVLSLTKYYYLRSPFYCYYDITTTEDIYIDSGTNYNDIGYLYLSNGRSSVSSEVVSGTAQGDTNLAFTTRYNGNAHTAGTFTHFGYFKAKGRNKTSFTYGSGYTFHNIESHEANEPTLVVHNSINTGEMYGINVIHTLDRNNTTSRFYAGQGAGTERIKIYSNGNIQNSNNSYGQLSDETIKENIVDATPKLDEINQVRVVNFNYIDDVDEETGIPNKQIGVVAQELEQIFPGLVYEAGNTEINENGKEIPTGETTKAVKYSVFVPMLIKAVQELTQEVQTLKDQINGIN